MIEQLKIYNHGQPLAEVGDIIRLYANGAHADYVIQAVIYIGSEITYTIKPLGESIQDRMTEDGNLVK